MQIVKEERTGVTYPPISIKYRLSKTDIQRVMTNRRLIIIHDNDTDDDQTILLRK